MTKNGTRCEELNGKEHNALTTTNVDIRETYIAIATYI
jgi:hypothetical protein